ncbi:MULTISPECIES: glycosyltransferase [unclassified Adlercreutzia]|uniref:glycosyltransferase family 2 protein n=1 Tax=unclassified Adlercreutzia TaxID=2636013 RepID=UPI0013EA4602|nr:MULTISPECIES: glycosyltransferase [unclassified Adlercreutzia]
MTKVSVVVPIYKVELYLRKCIESLLAQTLKDVELVLVDDGSPDRSGDIAESYAQRDPRVKVVHRENGGLGPARNTGIEAATGEYIGFVDSDDWVDADMYERLYRAAANDDADVCYSGLQLVRDSGRRKRVPISFSGSAFKEGEIHTFSLNFYGAAAKKGSVRIHASVCPAIYKRTLLMENNIRFRNVRSEDHFFNIEVCRASSMVVCVEGTPYCYRKQGQSSITNAFNPNSIEQFNNFFIALLDEAYGESEAYCEECIIRAQRSIIDYSIELIEKITESVTDHRSSIEYLKTVMALQSVKTSVLSYPANCMGFISRRYLVLLRRRDADSLLKWSNLVVAVKKLVRIVL